MAVALAFTISAQAATIIQRLAAGFASLAEGLGLGGKQHAVHGISKLTWCSCRCSGGRSYAPSSNPRFDGFRIHGPQVATQRQNTWRAYLQTPDAGIAAVMDKELSQHFRLGRCQEIQRELQPVQSFRGRSAVAGSFQTAYCGKPRSAL